MWAIQCFPDQSHAGSFEKMQLFGPCGGRSDSALGTRPGLRGISHSPLREQAAPSRAFMVPSFM